MSIALFYKYSINKFEYLIFRAVIFIVPRTTPVAHGTYVLDDVCTCWSVGTGLRCRQLLALAVLVFCAVHPMA